MVAKQRNNLGNTRRGLMKRGMLSDHFAAFAAKRLSVVDADPEKSNQHEVTGSKELRQILGDEDRKKENRFPATYIWFGGEQEAMSEEGRLAWYDSRANKPRAAERSEEHTSELQSLMRISYAVFCLKKKNTTHTESTHMYEQRS